MNVPAISGEWRSRLGNAAVLVSLLLLAMALLALQSRPWWQASPGSTRWWLAGVSLLAYVGWSGWILRRHAKQSLPATLTADTLRVVHASQTGFADLLAQRSAESLRATGMAVVVQPLESLRLQDLQAGRILFVVSTTGEGDPPDHALAFVRQVMAQSPRLHDLHYAVLALGDREYQHFCHFGRQLDDWLRQHGAQPLFDRVEVDNADESALRHWQHHLGQLAGATELPDWDLPRYERWTLQSRERLNAGSVGEPVFQVRLTPPADQPARWQSGDIAEIGPRHAATEIDALLAALGWDGEQPVRWRDESGRLADVLSQSHLPALAELSGRPVQAVVDALTPLPHREYSIASLPGDGTLDLVVRQMQRPDGRAGLGSGWLCVHAVPGAQVALRIRANANFHLPDTDVPLILIGNGTGIAGLRAHLKARAGEGRLRNWLLFGERQRAQDFLFRQEIESWQHEGVLTRVDLAFSRDQAERFYVQDALREAAVALRAWVDEGAAIFVCGSLEGMAPGVDTVLRDVLGEARVEALRMAGRYRRDVY